MPSNSHSLEDPSTSPNAGQSQALKCARAAAYLGLSPSLLKKMRKRRPGDPLDQGPAFIKVSRSCVIYPRSALDEWLAKSLERTKALSAGPSTSLVTAPPPPALTPQQINAQASTARRRSTRGKITRKHK